MEFPQQFPELTIPTGAGPGDERITINENQNGAILVYGPGGVLAASVASVAGTDSQGNAYQAGVTIYGPTTAINFLLSDGVWTSANGSKIDISVFGDASIFLQPRDNAFFNSFDAQISTNLISESGLRPSLDITSPEDQVNQRVSDIRLIGSGGSRTDTEIRMETDSVSVNGSDIGQGVQSDNSISANVTGITTTETTLITAPSMTFKNGRAYRVELFGLHQSTTADTYFLYRLRKGTGTGGTVYKDQMRVPTLNAVSTNGAVSLSFILLNQSGADITTTTTWTGSCAAGTGIFAASPGNMATINIADVGVATDWSGQPIS